MPIHIIHRQFNNNHDTSIRKCFIDNLNIHIRKHLQNIKKKKYNKTFRTILLNEHKRISNKIPRKST